MSGTDVRPATSDDLDAIHRFGEDVVHDTYDTLVDVSYANAVIEMWWSADALRADVDRGRILVATVQGRMAGLAQLGEWQDEAVMWKLYVAEPERNQGLGVRLVDELIASLPSGTPRLRTEHIVANGRAGDFYQREGFLVDEIEGAADDPTATVWRSKHLDPLWTDLASAMERAAVVDERTLGRIATELGREPAEVVLDIGCGVGSMTVALARALTGARVVAADSDPLMRIATRRRVAEHNLQDRVDVLSADIDHLEDLSRLEPAADVVWASFVVHHQPDQEATLRSLHSVIAPGGRLALAEGGLSNRSLPWDIGIGRPGLEVRLDAAQDAWFRVMRDELDSAVRTDLGWPILLGRAGFGDVTSRSYLVDHPAPLDDTGRHVIVDHLSWAAQRLAPAGLLDADDVATVHALLDVDGPHFVGRRDDTYLLSAQTVHVARR